MAKKENSLAHTKWMCKYHIASSECPGDGNCGVWKSPLPCPLCGWYGAGGNSICYQSGNSSAAETSVCKIGGKMV